MTIQPFQYSSHAQEVIFGAGVIQQLGTALRPYPWQRLLLCTSPHLVKSGQVDHLQLLLGKQLVAVYAGVSAHVPENELEECLILAKTHNIDAVIGLGGGSVIGMAKAVAYEWEARQNDANSTLSGFSAIQPLIPTIAIPTTYAGSEMTPVFGVTRLQSDGTTRKITITGPKITPKLVLYDPELTLDLPANLTISTGINALAHCIEAIYSITRNPLSTASALLAIRYLKDFLLCCYKEPRNLEARSGVLIGAHLAGKALASVEMGIHHGTCHVLGGTAGIPHGVANCIVLPHAIRFNSDTVGALIALSGEALGIERNDCDMAEATAQTVHNLIAQFGVPQRLRDVGVPESLLPTLAKTMLKSKAVQNNPKPVTVTAAMALLQAAW